MLCLIPPQDLKYFIISRRFYPRTAKKRIHQNEINKTALHVYFVQCLQNH